MEIEGQEEYGANIELNKGHGKTVFGRGFGFNTDDRTVSRRHVAFELKSGANQTEPTARVSFEVLGKNLVWVRSKDDDGEDKIKVFRRSEKGELAAGDWFCVSGKKPTWFALREKRVSEEEEIESAESSPPRSGSEFEGFDVSGIDPVKEFGFLVLGHEFEHYPKHMIRDVNSWDWFLEEEGKESEDEEDFEKKKKKRGVGKKRKKGEDDEDDEEWTGESEEDRELVGNVRKANSRPKYSTRSKDHRDKPHKDKSQGSKNSKQKKVYSTDNGNDEDETLGGFIVGDEDVDQEEETNGDDEEEEEDFEDDDDEVDDE